MFSSKPEDKKEQGDKRYLLVIVVLMILSAIALSLINFFKKGEAAENDQQISPVSKVENSDIKAAPQTYSFSSDLELLDSDKIIGTKDAELFIFVYEDYGDVLSAKFNDNLKALIDIYQGRIAFVLRPFVSSQLSSDNALALDCASDSGKWILFRNTIFSSLLGREKLEEEVEIGQEIYYYAEKSGLNKDDFVSCLTNNKKSGKIEQLTAHASSIGVKGSPTIFIKDEMILGARPLDDYTDSNGDRIEGLKSIIDRFLLK